jgi:uncharacterized cofD-like protein
MTNIEPKKNIVVIGGGTGTFVVLKGLKLYRQKLSAIVSMSDSGGSNKRIRDEFGLLPTSDLRQCLVALSDENGGVGLLRKLFMYRFEKGEGIAGMTFGNLFMAALTDILGSQQEAIKQTGKVLRIHGTVIPVTFTDTNLQATYENGTIASEEHFIDEPTHDGTLKITNLCLIPEAQANPEAISAIEKAHLVILGPGDLFTSILPNLIIPGIATALKNTKATVVYNMNLMTKYGQTYGFTASDHVRILEQYIGTCIKTIIINNSPIPDNVLAAYEKGKEFPVVDDIKDVTSPYHIIRADVVSSEMTISSKEDKLVRSLIRHDSDKLAKVLFDICTKGGTL